MELGERSLTEQTTGWTVWDSIPDRHKGFFVLQNLQTLNGVNTPSYSKGTGFFSGKGRESGRELNLVALASTNRRG